MNIGKDNIKFSEHAFDKLIERLSIDEDEVRDIIENDAYICIREEKIKRYLLFYSEADKQHYVIVQDKKNHEIITILYIDYFNHFKISMELTNQAEKIARDVGKKD